LKLRVLVLMSLATITLAAAVACVVAGSFGVAGGFVGCAIVIAGLTRTKFDSCVDAKALLETLRVAQRAGAVAVNAVVTSKIIFIAKSEISDAASSGHALLFRDEIDVAIWRELTTFLRHQAHAQPELKKVDQVAAHRLGKSFDL
jgi:hypothetical protein